MEDTVLVTLERAEKRTFTMVVFIAKIITWITLLLLGLMVEAALVIKLYNAEFGVSHRATAESSAVGSTGFEILTALADSEQPLEQAHILSAEEARTLTALLTGDPSRVQPQNGRRDRNTTAGSTPRDSDKNLNARRVVVTKTLNDGKVLVVVYTLRQSN